MWAIHYDVTILITFKTPNVRAIPCYVAMFLALETSPLSSSFDVMLTIDGGVMVAVSCCTTLSFSTLDIALLRVCSPFSYMWVLSCGHSSNP